ncbi:sensor histidine kinase [Nonomuraea rhizosphaerae]|uniref:sensor histidine kinase n=1 Tax=Nonomuraea rhizosphaerae TaxID=2665663 RepID=UPI001C5CCA0D|nr:histidine kinase [Nonomuraea rhizosphaerae]
MLTRTALEALVQRPLPFLRSAWPWRCLVYLLASAVPGLVVVAAGMGALQVGLAVDAVPLGVVAAIGVLVLAAPLAGRFERGRLRLVDAVPLPDMSDRRRREAVLTVVTVFGLWWIDLVMVGVTVGGPVLLMLSPVVQPESAGGLVWVAVGAGVSLVPVAAYTVTAWAGARGVMVRAMLAPPELNEVLRSRARLVDAFEAERRRIERDLHDGAQQRLVALSMTLGLARLDLADDDPVGRLVERAHGEAKQALAELRELIRGVHPQVLTDRGLGAAVRDLAGRSPVPVGVEIDLGEEFAGGSGGTEGSSGWGPRSPVEGGAERLRGHDSGRSRVRLPAPVENTAYYVITEALANTAKHAQATAATVTARMDRDALVVEVRDDGCGGADPGGGTGLTGLADRVAVVGGRLSLSSPVGGPTLLRVEIPCAW